MMTILMHTITLITAALGIIFLALLFFRYSAPLHRLCSIYRISRPGSPRGLILGDLDPWGKLQVCLTPRTEGHIYIAGPTGTGKTVCLIGIINSFISSMENENVEGRVFAIDISGDIASNADIPGALTYAPEREDTIPYDPFGLIALLSTHAERLRGLEGLADIIIPDFAGVKTDGGEYYRKGGKEILKACLFAFWQQKSLAEIAHLILVNDHRTLFTMIDQTGDKDAMACISAYVHDNSVGGCYSNCCTAVRPFASPEMLRSLHKAADGETAITPMSIEDNSIFIEISDQHLEYFAPVMALISGQFLQYLASRRMHAGSPEILLCLDEYASLNLDIIPSLRKLRKRHCHCVIASQAVTADIKMIYQDDAARAAFLTNIRHLIVLGAGDPDDQQYLAKLAGMHRPRDGGQKDWQIPPEQFGRLHNRLICLHDGEYMTLYKHKYYRTL